MSVMYNKLFGVMNDKNMSNVELQDRAGISANIITRIKRNQYISLESIEKICKALDCNVDDIIDFTDDKIINSGVE